MSLLALEAVGKTYGDRRLLDGVSLLVAEGDRIGLLGPNGAGKSTLLRMLAGAEEPDEGRRTARRGLRIGYLPQDPTVDPQATVRDAVRAGIPGRQEVVDALDALHRTLAVGDVDGERLQRLLDEQAKLDERLDGVGGHDVEHRIESTIRDVGLPDPEQRCGPLSGGERRRVAIARLLIAEPELLLLDEPTNHLDAEVIDWLEDRLLQSRAALVLVTHDRYFLDRVVTRIIEVDRTALFGYDGAYSEYVMQRAARLEREARAESTRLNLLRRETAWIRRGAPARSTKARARVQRYDALVEAEPDQAERELTFRIPCGQRLGEKVLALHEVGKSFGERRILDGFDLEIGRGDRIGIVGPNGAGKSTLLQICLGRMPPDRGRVEIGPTVAFSAIDQRREGLVDHRTVFDEVGRGNDHIVVDGRAMRIESFLEAMLFDGSRARTRVGDLSGGERNRVLLAKLLATAGNVLVLDEPTNDLDLATLQVLEEALVAFAGAALIVSHDRWFLDRVATRIVHLDGQGAHRIWNGDLSRLLERLAEERRAKVADRGSRRGATASRPASPPRPPKLGSRERRELEGLPDRISAAEQAVAAVDARLADPALYAGEPRRVQELADERARAQAEVDALYARWEELESIAADG